MKILLAIILFVAIATSTAGLFTTISRYLFVIHNFGYWVTLFALLGGLMSALFGFTQLRKY